MTLALNRLIASICQLVTSGTFRTLSIFAGGNLLIAVLGGLGGIIQARWITPEVFGEFRKYGILTGYLNIGLIVVHDALMRHYPYLIGKGDRAEALRFVSAAKWWYMTLSHLFSALLVCLTVFALFRGEYRASVGWGVQIIVVWNAIYGAYLGVIYRTSQDFKRLTYNNLMGNVCGFLLLPAVKFFGYWGVAARNGLLLATGLLLNHNYAPVQVEGRFDRIRLVQLAKMSLPLSVPGFINTSLTGATVSYVILRLLGEADLGIYGMSLALQSMAMTVTTSLCQICYPKIMHKFGEAEDFLSCVKYTLRPTCLNLALSVVIVAMLCLLIAPFVRMVIPKYVASIPIIRILSVNIILTALALPFVVFVSALKYRTIISLSIVRFVACFGMIGLLPKTLPMIVWCTIVAEFVYVLSGYGVIFKMQRDQAVVS